MCYHVGGMFQLPLNKLAYKQHFDPEENCMECTVGFSWVELHDITVGNVCSLPLKVQSRSLNAQWVWHIWKFQRFGKRYQLLTRIKSWAR